jgi:hypothetical protein
LILVGLLVATASKQEVVLIDYAERPISPSSVRCSQDMAMKAETETGNALSVDNGAWSCGPDPFAVVAASEWTPPPIESVA